MQLKGKVSQIQDSHCWINTDSDSDPAPGTLSYATNVRSPSHAGTRAVSVRTPVDPTSKTLQTRRDATEISRRRLSELTNILSQSAMAGKDTSEAVISSANLIAAAPTACSGSSSVAAPTCDITRCGQSEAGVGDSTGFMLREARANETVATETSDITMLWPISGWNWEQNCMHATNSKSRLHPTNGKLRDT